jgi:hypothetical protein
MISLELAIDVNAPASHLAPPARQPEARHESCTDLCLLSLLLHGT